MNSGNIMHRLFILIALFIISSCTAHKATKAVPASVAAPATAAPAPAAASVSAKIVDRGAETSRAIDGADTPGLDSTDPAIHAWQVSVIEKLKPYMRWPDNAPYWVESAAPTVRVIIDRRGKVLKASVVRSSGYEAFDAAARKIFKRAAILPPPPAEMPRDPLTFTMAVTYRQKRR
jgi:periplasmic protein TonB